MKKKDYMQEGTHYTIMWHMQVLGYKLLIHWVLLHSV